MPRRSNTSKAKWAGPSGESTSLYSIRCSPTKLLPLFDPTASGPASGHNNERVGNSFRVDSPPNNQSRSACDERSPSARIVRSTTSASSLNIPARSVAFASCAESSAKSAATTPLKKLFSSIHPSAERTRRSYRSRVARPDQWCSTTCSPMSRTTRNPTVMCRQLSHDHSRPQPPLATSFHEMPMETASSQCSVFQSRKP